MIKILTNPDTMSDISLGRQGESNVVVVSWDISNWRKLYGNGIVSLLHQRKGDEYPYPCVITQTDDKVSWIITKSDTAIHGIGKCQLIYTVENNVVAKSKICNTYVHKSIESNTVNPPEPYSDWVDKIISVGVQAQEAAKLAESTANDMKAQIDSFQYQINQAKMEVVQSIESIASQKISDIEKLNSCLPIPQKQDIGKIVTVSPTGENYILTDGNESDTWEFIRYIPLQSDTAVYTLAEVADFKKIKLLILRSPNSELNGTCSIRIYSSTDILKNYLFNYVPNGRSYQEINIEVDNLFNVSGNYFYGSNFQTGTSLNVFSTRGEGFDGSANYVHESGDVYKIITVSDPSSCFDGSEVARLWGVRR